MPDRGLGAKKVVFCGMRARFVAAARVCATETGLHRIAASAAPLSTCAATAARVVPVAPRRFRERGARPALRRRRRRWRRRPGPRRPARSPGASALRDREVRGRLVDDAEPVLGRPCGACSALDLVASSTRRTRRRRRRRASRATRSTSAGRSSRRWMGSMSSSSSTSSTTSIMIAAGAARSRSPAARSSSR